MLVWGVLNDISRVEGVILPIVLAKAAAARGLPPFSSVDKLPTKYRDSNQGAR